MKKLTICMISSEFPPNAAGIGNAAYRLSKALIKNGDRVVVITRGSWRGEKARTMDGIKVYALPFIPFFPPFHILYHSFFMKRLLKKIGNSLDIIHMHSPLIPVVNTKIPTVVTVHSTWHSEAKAFNQLTDWYAMAVKLFKNSFIEYENKLFSQSDRFITISKSMAKELKQHYKINSNKIQVVRNSVDVQSYKSITAKNVNRPFNVLSISRLVYRKGVLDLVDAAKIICSKYPQTMFTIIGKGPLKNILLKRIKKYNLGKNFQLLGEVPHEQIKKYLQESSIFVIPSRYEGLPLALLEAIACGKPVIASNIEGIKEIITHNKNGLLVPSGNFKDLAKAIMKLIDDKNLRAFLGKNAKLSAKEFDNSKMIKKTLAIYRDILGRQNR